MPPTLFDNAPLRSADALALLAAAAVSREELQAAGYRNLAKSGDLFPYGYSVSFWVKPGVRESEVLEFNPHDSPGSPSGLPRLTATNYHEQAAIHEAIGARVVPPGKRFKA